MDPIPTTEKKPTRIKGWNLIRADKLDKLTKQIEREGLASPNYRDGMRILNLSPGQAAKYVRAWRDKKTTIPNI
jgi:hypothetical protein